MSHIDQFVGLHNAILVANTFRARGVPPRVPNLFCDVIRMLDTDWSVSIMAHYF